MNDQMRKADDFRALHRAGAPLVLYNIWDAGGARALADAGAPAVATGSHSVAAAHGYDDGEAIPLDLVLTLVERIVASVPCPVSIDFEGGYAESPEGLAANAARLIATGAIGINFEDQVVQGEGLYDIPTQQARIGAIRDAADRTGVPLFINARTDVYLQAGEGDDPGDLLAQTLERGHAYAAAGADGFFVPWLVDHDAIRTICRELDAPINVMMRKPLESIAELAALGVARVSHGPGPYNTAIDALVERYRAALRLSE